MKKSLGPVEYTIFIQRIFFVGAIISFIAFILMMVLLDPTQSIYYMYAFLILLFLFLISIISLIAFWWVFSIRKQILTVYQVNQLVGQSVISSAVVITTLVMHQTKQLNLWTGLFIIGCYGLYQIWVNSESK